MSCDLGRAGSVSLRFRFRFGFGRCERMRFDGGAFPERARDGCATVARRLRARPRGAGPKGLMAAGARSARAGISIGGQGGFPRAPIGCEKRRRAAGEGPAGAAPASSARGPAERTSETARHPRGRVVRRKAPGGRRAGRAGMKVIRFPFRSGGRRPAATAAVLLQMPRRRLAVARRRARMASFGAIRTHRHVAEPRGETHVDRGTRAAPRRCVGVGVGVGVVVGRAGWGRGGGLGGLGGGGGGRVPDGRGRG